LYKVYSQNILLNTADKSAVFLFLRPPRLLLRRIHPSRGGELPSATETLRSLAELRRSDLFSHPNNVTFCNFVIKNAIGIAAVTPQLAVEKIFGKNL